VSAKRTVPVMIQGKQYKIRAEADDESITRAASLLDETIAKVRERTSATDSVDVTILAALNLANLLTTQGPGSGARGIPIAGERILELIRLVEGAVGDAKPASS
jgi:cell division protein ZapA (FtsZ GTPase activity inhibitor)